MTLTEFLEARIAEDEADAGRLSAEGIASHSGAVLTYPWHDPFGKGDPYLTDRWNPVRVLAECEAKRLIVGLCAAPMVDVTAMGERERRFIPGEGMPWGEPVLRALGAVYADHSDYDEEWKP